MDLYRIATTRNIRDLRGGGARIYGGRWNHKGTGIIYTSESRALATVEYLVHVPLSLIPANISIATIHIPDRVKPKSISVRKLPRNWRRYPSPSKLADIGSEWVRSNESLLLRIPSAVVDGEFNILINPQHPDMKDIAISRIEKYKFDDRLLK
jgi:RES domain-containing protein